jgi:hypothetical protein
MVVVPMYPRLGVAIGVLYFTPMRLAQRDARRRITRNFAALCGLPLDANLPTGVGCHLNV